ncbi:galactose-1-phosphate uridylyltransferase [bacterium]|nr:galactose-1-phosphate uridylyltransferase [bacterium]
MRNNGNDLNSEIRKDPVIGRWVIVGHDKGYVAEKKESIQRKANPSCPFCPGNESSTPPEILSVEKDGKWQIRVIPNKYPALSSEGEIKREGVGLFDKMSGIGAHEVIIETPDHLASVTSLTVEQFTEVLKVFRSRFNELKKDERFRHVLLFKNEGHSAGASIEHSHSQIIATPIIPKRVQEELDGAEFYYSYKKRCVFCDMLELDNRFFKERVVIENDNMCVISPFAARFPFEMWVLPKKHFSTWENSDDEMLRSQAEILLSILRALDDVLGNPPYNIILHSSPINGNCDNYYHWHFEIIPKMKRIAGFEWGTGFYINPVPPEEAAEVLKRRLNR